MQRVLQKAINQNGIVNQLDQCLEELGELIVAINKLKRAKLIDVKNNIIKSPMTHNLSIAETFVYHDICGEVADVQIMMEQLNLMLNSDVIELIKKRKINRLKDRLNKKSIEDEYCECLTEYEFDSNNLCTGCGLGKNI